MTDLLISALLFLGILFAVFFTVALFIETDESTSPDSGPPEPASGRFEEE